MPALNSIVEKTGLKIAEFSGLRGEAAWLDGGMRFVFTRIDDTREGAVFPGLSYGLKVSAVLYDSAVEETIPLKEADETRTRKRRAATKELISGNNMHFITKISSCFGKQLLI